MKSGMSPGVSNSDSIISTLSAPVSQENIHSLEKLDAKCTVRGKQYRMAYKRICILLLRANK